MNAVCGQAWPLMKGNADIEENIYCTRSKNMLAFKALQNSSELYIELRIFCYNYDAGQPISRTLLLAIFDISEQTMFGTQNRTNTGNVSAIQTMHRAHACTLNSVGCIACYSYFVLQIEYEKKKCNLEMMEGELNSKFHSLCTRFFRLIPKCTSGKYKMRMV